MISYSLLYVKSQYDVFRCLKFAELLQLQSTRFYRTQCSVSTAIDRYSQRCVYRALRSVVLLASRQDLPHLRTRQYNHVPCNTCHRKQCALLPPLLCTRFIAPVVLFTSLVTKYFNKYCVTLATRSSTFKVDVIFNMLRGSHAPQFCHCMCF